VGELYVTWEYWITFAQLVMAMLAMGATLAVHDFVAVVKLPRSFLTGLVAQMAVVPAAAYLLLRATDLDPGVAVGLAILASVPGGTISNVVTYAGRGDVPLSIAITAVTSLACVVTVPIVLGVLAGDQVAAGVELPRARIAGEIVVTLLVPLGIGMAVLRRAPEVAARLSRVALILTSVLIATIVVGSAAAGRLDVEAMGLGNLAVVAGFAVAMAAIGVGAGVVARRPRTDILAIAIEITVRNTNLGLLVRASAFSAAGAASSVAADLALFTILAYAAISLALAVPLVAWGRRVVGAGSRPTYGFSEPTTHMAKNCEPPP
jgi:BASS family bile acid:Na+ symporter